MNKIDIEYFENHINLKPIYKKNWIKKFRFYYAKKKDVWKKVLDDMRHKRIATGDKYYRLLYQVLTSDK